MTGYPHKYRDLSHTPNPRREPRFFLQYDEEFQTSTYLKLFYAQVSYCGALCFVLFSTSNSRKLEQWTWTSTHQRLFLAPFPYTIQFPPFTSSLYRSFSLWHWTIQNSPNGPKIFLGNLDLCCFLVFLDDVCFKSRDIVCHHRGDYRTVVLTIENEIGNVAVAY